jgi:hypothetical protein
MLQYAVPPQTCRTGLVEKCAALGTWVIDSIAERLEPHWGFISPIYLDKIQSLVDMLRNQGYPIPLFTLQ